MKKLFIITASIFLTTSLFYGCRGKEKIKPAASDAVTTASKNSTIGFATSASQNPDKAIDATTAATVSTVKDPALEGISFEGVGQSYDANPVNILQEDWLTKFAGGKA